MTKKEAKKYNEKLKMVQELKEKGIPVRAAKKIAGVEIKNITECAAHYSFPLNLSPHRDIHV